MGDAAGSGSTNEGNGDGLDVAGGEKLGERLGRGVRVDRGERVDLGDRVGLGDLVGLGDRVGRGEDGVGLGV